MLPFKITSVVVCDDVRQEINNKHILIGVYNGTMVIPGFPAEIPLCWWLQIFTKELGKFEVEVRVMKDGTSTLLRAALQYEVHNTDWASLVLPKVLLQFQGPGKIKLQMKIKDQEEWEDVQELEVKMGAIS